MIYKFLIVLHFFGLLGLNSAPKEHQIKAWIEIEGELNALSVKAKIENTGNENVFLNYELEIFSRSRIKKQKTLEKGKFLALKQSVFALSESRMNVKITEELCVQIKVLQDNQIVALDSVVFHGAKK
ncbi:hypothetical protein EO244_15205 [Ancylomarina salipaludis]|uniref:Uncharacterized protein n=1 Tax=Ancylomarina salipaludis TaxID=2501299 RepID=A0A4Q1JJC2_9BACT|nr:hypothetical protein [Ancylomarina salipaludis]RXQ88477.1 hypothetical protein EO244_15205 [Ancylomarina salipaludis]